jgi:hypothetical protein
MKVKNRLKTILESNGIQEFKPTEELLGLLGMSRRRFFQVMKNSAVAQELNAPEIHKLEDWLIEAGYIKESRELFYAPCQMIGKMNLQPIQP